MSHYDIRTTQPRYGYKVLSFQTYKTICLIPLVYRVSPENRKRRERAKRTPSRPSSYRYAGLEERTTVMIPERVAAGECDIIGKDASRILHR